jgi:hypothetical protein
VVTVSQPGPHTVPAVPQFAGKVPVAMQVSPLQQPEVQLAVVQMQAPEAWSQVRPPVQGPQGPGVPQSRSSWLAYGTHVSPLQQPLPQLVALHTQTPPEQVWPEPHGAVPAAPQTQPTPSMQ